MPTRIEVKGYVLIDIYIYIIYFILYEIYIYPGVNPLRAPNIKSVSGSPIIFPFNKSWPGNDETFLHSIAA